MTDKSLNQSLAEAQAELKNAPLDKVNPHFKSKYASLASVRDAVIPVLSQHGVACNQMVKGIEGAWVVVTRLSKGDQSIEDATPILFDANAKNSAQSFGSALTYARRYSLSSIVCISADEDDDGNAASKASDQSTLISATELAELNARLDETNSDKGAFCKAFGIVSLNHLPKSKLRIAYEKIDQKVKREAEQATKAQDTATPDTPTNPASIGTVPPPPDADQSKTGSIEGVM